MAKLTVALPAALKDWVEAQAENGLYTDAEKYLRDLIRRDQVRATAVAEFQSLVEDGLASGVTDESMPDILSSLKSERLRSA
uniref:ribbon-helix-helix domain-containing protein n=1 Tax=uncultured Rhizobium sp. TaxID=155567 RepID=UPI00261C4605|nr:type II toxin-antitoxin system ParD family antitoxin [uncultured Rhizobium sp.]